ncbi:MAG: arginine--tRNA ligase [Lachnospiraceae bacterium]|nr:arginine--tRNA ligase [Lachnospiraceae bacterium]MCR5211657.1 arginine--tRNA ligase [Lachnospiraceae bacterium]
MQKFLDLLSERAGRAFEKAGIDPSFGRVKLSDRPELCEFQTSGALAAAKQYKKNPMEIAEKVSEELSKDEAFSSSDAVRPGFVNLNVSNDFLLSYIKSMYEDEERLGVQKTESPKKIIMDYGGPNVAKPLHVGHLRSAVIGESIKRILRFIGHDVIADIHLGDFGLQMGLIIAELSERKPSLPYFDPDFSGAYPEEPPFTISELEDIYPSASKRSKEDVDFAKKASDATYEMQQGRRGYRELLSWIMKVSLADLKRNYERLSVSFDLWKGEADAEPYIPGMVKMLKDKGLAHESDGALVVDVKRDDDKKEIPPCMILKSDGAALYDTTDLATLIWRVEDHHPDEIIYVVDKRQDLHFIQVFRCARMAGIVPDETELSFIGFGTVNGPDGHALKTRDGGVMRLESLLDDIKEKMHEKIMENDSLSPEEADIVSDIVSLSAVKYGDLKNQPAKDYIFDMDRFTSSEGDTGPYILYTVVRIKSIIRKFEEAGGDIKGLNPSFSSEGSEKALMLSLSLFNAEVEKAASSCAPNIICAYIYQLCNEFNHFYHETKILSCEDEDEKKSYVALCRLTQRVLEKCIELLGFEAPEKM